MKRVTNRKSRSAVESKTEFQGSNLSGKWEGGLYVVRSYKWYVIFFYDLEAKQWYENKDGYSRSTRRQISQCLPQHEPVLQLDRDFLESVLKTYNERFFEGRISA